jgi:hypothetical protein
MKTRILFSVIMILTVSWAMGQEKPKSDLYLLVNGKHVSQAEFELAQKDSTAIMYFIPSDKAIMLYGPQAKNGAIDLTTRYPVSNEGSKMTEVVLRITNSKGKPVARAKVLSENGSILAYSDKCGWVRLENFSQGNTVTISTGKKTLKNLVISNQVMHVKL